MQLVILEYPVALHVLFLGANAAMDIYVPNYIDQVRLISHHNEALSKYIEICENALQRSSSKREATKLLGYNEAHHILPKSFKMGGEKDKSNLVYLLPEEHFKCHQLLAEFLINKRHLYQMSNALNRMSTSKNSGFYNMTPEDYAFIRRQVSKNCSGENNPFFGKSHSDKTKQEIGEKSRNRAPITETTRELQSKASLGKPKSEDHRKNISKGRTGMKRAPFSEEHRKNISKRLTGVKRGPYRKATSMSFS